jgi:hypothetical protein
MRLQISYRWILVLAFILTLSLSGCIETDVKRYASAWILTLLVGVILLVVKLLSGGNNNS